MPNLSIARTRPGQAGQRLSSQSLSVRFGEIAPSYGCHRRLYRRAAAGRERSVVNDGSHPLQPLTPPERRRSNPGSVHATSANPRMVRRVTWTTTCAGGVSSLLEHPVRANLQRLRYRYTNPLRRLHVDHELELRRLLDGKVPGVRSPEDLSDIPRGITAQLLDAGTVGQEPADLRKRAVCAHGRQSSFQGQLGNSSVMHGKDGIRQYVQRRNVVLAIATNAVSMEAASCASNSRS